MLFRSQNLGKIYEEVKVNDNKIGWLSKQLTSTQRNTFWCNSCHQSESCWHNQQQNSSPAGSLFRISVKQQRKSSNIHKTKHVLAFIHVYTFLLSLLKYTLISSLIYSDSFFYFITWNENTIVFINFYFKYLRIHNTVRAVISINVVISYSCQCSHLQLTQWVYSHGQG